MQRLSLRGTVPMRRSAAATSTPRRLLTTHQQHHHQDSSATVVNANANPRKSGWRRSAFVVTLGAGAVGGAVFALRGQRQSDRAGQLWAEALRVAILASDSHPSKLGWVPQACGTLLRDEAWLRGKRGASTVASHSASAAGIWIATVLSSKYQSMAEGDVIESPLSALLFAMANRGNDPDSAELRAVTAETLAAVMLHPQLQGEFWDNGLIDTLKSLYDGCSGDDIETRTRVRYSLALCLGSLLSEDPSRADVLLSSFGTERLLALTAAAEKREVSPPALLAGPSPASPPTTRVFELPRHHPSFAFQLASGLARAESSRFDSLDRHSHVPSHDAAALPDVKLLSALSASHDPSAAVQVMRWCANAGGAGRLNRVHIRDGVMENVASSLASRELTPGSNLATNLNGIAQVARLLANVTAYFAALDSPESGAEGSWRRKLEGWMNLQVPAGVTDQRVIEGVAQVRLCATVALANVTSSEAASDRLLRDEGFVAAVKTAVKTAVTRQGRLPMNVEIAGQLARMMANLSRSPELACTFSGVFGLSPIARLVQATLSNDPILSARDREQLTIVNSECAHALAHLSTCESFAATMAEGERDCWLSVYRLAHCEDPAIQQQLARLIANFAANPATISSVRSRDGVQAILNRWLSDPTVNPTIIAHAIRAHASMASDLLRSSPKYADGIFVLAGPHSTASTAYSREEEPVLDVVFLHGATGHPYTTWTQLTPEIEAEALQVPLGGRKSAPGTVSDGNDFDSDEPKPPHHEVVIWPRDWLAKDLGPRVRILSVGFDVAFTKWVGDSVPMKLQGEEIAQKLKLAGVGQRPCVFVAHSMGGLLVKRILQLGQTDERFRPLLDQTKGIVFFSTPHRGAEITHYLEQLKLTKLLRTTVAIEDLKSGPQLDELHENFLALQKKRPIPTLAFGENDKTCLGTTSKYTCIQLVSDASANPSIGGPQHAFVKLDFDHRTACKPRSKQDANYDLVRRFIQDVTAGQPPHSSVPV